MCEGTAYPCSTPLQRRFGGDSSHPALSRLRLGGYRTAFHGQPTNETLSCDFRRLRVNRRSGTDLAIGAKFSFYATFCKVIVSIV